MEESKQGDSGVAKQSDSGVTKQSDPEIESKILAAIAEGASAFD